MYIKGLVAEKTIQSDDTVLLIVYDREGNEVWNKVYDTLKAAAMVETKMVNKYWHHGRNLKKV